MDLLGITAGGPYDRPPFSSPPPSGGWQAGSAVPGFLPSTSAFRFTNSFAVQPLLRARAPALGWSLSLGDASRGLCGGMIFAVRDLFEAGMSPPSDEAPPRHGSPLYAYLVRRLFDSFDLPRGVARYHALMRGPDATLTVGQRLGVAARSLADEWPRIRLDLDAGRLSPLGLVTVRATDPRQLGLNHQVLAYAYDQAGTVVTLRVHDPNTPVDQADDVTVTFDLADAASITATATGRTIRPPRIDHSIAIGGRPVRAFFRTRYRWTDPSRALGAPQTPA